LINRSLESATVSQTDVRWTAIHISVKREITQNSRRKKERFINYKIYFLSVTKFLPKKRKYAVPNEGGKSGLKWIKHKIFTKHEKQKEESVQKAYTMKKTKNKNKNRFETVVIQSGKKKIFFKFELLLLITVTSTDHNTVNKTQYSCLTKSTPLKSHEILYLKQIFECKNDNFNE
jgi:hypothetical protein